LQKGPWKDCNPLQSGPWSRISGGGVVDQSIPARGFAGGEGRGAREKEWAMAHLMVCLKGWIKGWRRLASDGIVHGGGGACRQVTPVREWRG